MRAKLSDNEINLFALVLMALTCFQPYFTNSLNFDFIIRHFESNS
jgi:hypothetical protein